MVASKARFEFLRLARKLGLIRREEATTDFRNTKFWITVLLALWVALNALAFAVYAAAHPDQPFWAKLWNYGQSDAAKLIAASLVLPLLIFLVEGRFKVTETIRVNRLERVRKAQDERRAARLATIERTAQVWSNLFQITTEITSRSDPLNLTDLRVKVYHYPIVANQLMNTWRVRFPNLATRNELFEAYSDLGAMINECAASTMFHLQQAPTPEERDALRGSLDLIAGTINSAADDPVLGILNASLELMELRESLEIGDLRMVESKAQLVADEARWEKQISDNLAILGGMARSLRSYLPASETLDTIDGPAVQSFRKLFAEIAESLGDKEPSDDPRFGELRKRYLEIPRVARIHAWSVKYSPRWLAHLADEMAYNEVMIELKTRAGS